MTKFESEKVIDYQNVDNLANSINKLESQAKKLESLDLGLSSWGYQFESIKQKIEEKTNEIEQLKTQIMSFDNTRGKNELDTLVLQLQNSKKEYVSLTNEAANTANVFVAGFDSAFAALVDSN